VLIMRGLSVESVGGLTLCGKDSPICGRSPGVDRAMRLAGVLLAVGSACGATQPAPAAAADPIEGQLPDGRSVRLVIDGDCIASLDPITAAPAAAERGWLWPTIVDSHVHLVYWPVGERLATTGIGVAIDLAGPERTLIASDTRPVGARAALHLLASGPMLTRERGYPLDSWGVDGYGIGCGDVACVTQAIDRLAARGARVIKIALDDNGLSPGLLAAAVTAAHGKQLRVAVHALSDASAALAAAAGVDLLAHTPVEPLADTTVAAWSKGAVVSTLAAFGGGPAAIDNLRRLRAAGTTVLYGTDLGNTRDAGPSADEVALLRDAGLDDAAITAAMTTVPLAYWQLPLATLERGSEATLLVLARDPRTDATALLAARGVYLRGQRLR
jgi:imidazolonepropionase-like amidohydrolase